MPPPLTPAQEKFLYHVYYIENLAFGREEFFKLVQFTGMSKRQVWDWLSNEESQLEFIQYEIPFTK
jgi:hypothetical protein